MSVLTKKRKGAKVSGDGDDGEGKQQKKGGWIKEVSRRTEEDEEVRARRQ